MSANSGGSVMSSLSIKVGNAQTISIRPASHCRDKIKWVARAEQDWRYGDVHLIDKALAKILLDDIDAATHANIFACGGLAGALKSDGSTFRYDVKGRSAVHD